MKQTASLRPDSELYIFIVFHVLSNMHLKALQHGCNGCFASDHKNHLMKSRKYTLFILKYTHPACTAVCISETHGVLAKRAAQKCCIHWPTERCTHNI